MFDRDWYVNRNSTNPDNLNLIKNSSKINYGKGSKPAGWKYEKKPESFVSMLFNSVLFPLSKFLLFALFFIFLGSFFMRH